MLASLPARWQYGGATPVQPFATHMQIVHFAFSPLTDARIDAALGENARPVSDFHFAIISKGRAANVVSLLRLFQGTGADVTWCAPSIYDRNRKRMLLRMDDAAAPGTSATEKLLHTSPRLTRTARVAAEKPSRPEDCEPN